MKFSVVKCIVVCCLCLLFNGCEIFLEVDPPREKIPSDIVFKTDATAIAAVEGIYITLYDQGQSNFASGANTSISELAGLSSDELKYAIIPGDPQTIDFQRNALTANNLQILALWTSLYKIIYQTNALMEGVSKSDGITSATRDQLLGEALFVRAFCHFYLVNCFGDVPIVLTTNYRVNASLHRSSKDLVNDQIESDLLQAEQLLTNEYPTARRVRPNKLTVTAMLARFYLFTEDWARAEDKSTNVLQSGLYNLPRNLNAVFTATSQEAIWQLKPTDGKVYTNEGRYFDSTNITSTLRETIFSEYEANDKRAAQWINQVGSVYLPYKYKATGSAAPVAEYSMVLRLAEQYFIRSESRLRQDKVALAISDLDEVRDRAGISLIQNSNPGISKENLLLAIEHERKLELFSEWGHRWFDLKRYGRTALVLAPLKTDWSAVDELYPVPATEISINPNLKPQNSGY